MGLYRLIPRLGVLLGLCFGAASAAAERPIDRHALVARHNPEITRLDPHAPLMIGNGTLGFSADITGLQTFPDAYSPTAPLLIMAQWAWHSFPNPNNYTEADGLTDVQVPGRGQQPYAWADPAATSKPAITWLRENPHRFSLGRLALVIQDPAGQPARLGDISEASQRLDLWSGALISRFVYDHQPVTVQTRVHPTRDMVLIGIESPLIASHRVGVEVRYPGVSSQLNPDPSDWAHDDAHRTSILERSHGRLLVRRQLDAVVYYSAIVGAVSGTMAAGSSSGQAGARIDQVGTHRFRVLAGGGDRLIVLVSFDRQRQPAPRAESYDSAVDAVSSHWRQYWAKGGAIDFSGSADPRAPELERRVVLSQYLTAVNASGELPPQEEGLFSNSWNGKFHLEMHPWHEAHFATWGRPELLERSLGWYRHLLPDAERWAALHRVHGAWWPKMVGPEGRNSPGSINPFIMWQQPHLIFLAELLYRAQPRPATLERYGALVDETARLLASWPRWDPTLNSYVLGPPIIPVQENHPPLTTVDPAFELEYFRWGLQTAQRWRERRGLARDPEWDRVITQLAPVAERGGLYLPVRSEPDFWDLATSPACKRNATAAQCPNRDHPSFLMAYGLIGSDRIDLPTFRRTLRVTEENWDTRQLWGWDFPVVAMAAARLGEPETALKWLLRDEKNNEWGVSGMTPRFELTERKADTYFPSNGALLLAVGMMAAGWEGSTGHAPGFPRQGWTVNVEGIQPLPDPVERYRNPVLFADYSDPDVIRVDRTYYLVASSFHFSPGLPILESPDLVHWRIIGHVLPTLPFAPEYNMTPPFTLDDATERPIGPGLRYAGGVWAPSIRYHDGLYYVYWPTPREGVFMATAKRPEGPWSAPVTVIAGPGLEDPCPFWDDDGNAYLVHSRVGAGPLILHKMTPDGTRVLDAGRTIVEDKENLPVLEGPKLYKRNGWYYIFAPTGGVEKGSQVVLRAHDIYGPYEARVVLEQGTSHVQGPHQGGYVETSGGQDWFMHFNSTGAFGRIVYLEPVKWESDWPLIGDPIPGKTSGQPVAEHAAPDVRLPAGQFHLQAADEFNGPALGLQWEWNHNPDNTLWSLTDRPGFLRLCAPPARSLVTARNTLTQILQGPGMEITARIDISRMSDGQRAGLALFGARPSWIGVVRRGGHSTLTFSSAGAEAAGPRLDRAALELRARVAPDQTGRFSFSLDAGRHFQPLGPAVPLQFSWWKSARPALFSYRDPAEQAPAPTELGDPDQSGRYLPQVGTPNSVGGSRTGERGCLDVDWVHVRISQ